MIAHAGDTSNLILDPDLDSYYLMDCTVLALPQTQDRLTSIIGNGYRSLKSEKLTQEQRIQLAVDASLLDQSDLQRTLASAKTSLDADPNPKFYGRSETLQSNLPPRLRDYEAANAAFICCTGSAISARGSTPPLASFECEGSSTPLTKTMRRAATPAKGEACSRRSTSASAAVTDKRGG